MIALGVSSPPSSSSSSSSRHVLASFSSLRISPPVPSSRVSSFYGTRLGAGLRAAAPRVANTGRLVVKMAKREEEMKEIREKTTEDINEEVIDLKGELVMLRLQKAARRNVQRSEFLQKRRRIARMLTVKREREMEEGINKRLSRKLDRKWKRSIVVRPPPSLRKMQEARKAAEADKSS